MGIAVGGPGLFDAWVDAGGWPRLDAGVRVWQASLEQAVAAAEGDGFRVVGRGLRGARVQRDWRTAATINEVDGGVVVHRATTPAMVVLAVVSALTVCFLIGVLPGATR
jgi:hypothetical protein